MSTKSLAQSRWANPQRTTQATSTSKSASPEKQNPSSTQELARFMKIVSRLKWKLPFLSEGYRVATARFGASPDDLAHAEIMFKIDFHEYYALLERAIVHLLAVFGIAVHNSGYNDNGTARTGNHRYHAKVLEALEEKSCPLYSCLGCGTVRDQLKRAKQLRNRWKTADSPEDDDIHTPAFSSPTDITLESYDLEAILTGIFTGLEQGYDLAQKHVMKYKSEMDVEADINGDALHALSQWNSENDWDFIVDAMDWEAV